MSAGLEQNTTNMMKILCPENTTNLKYASDVNDQASSRTTSISTSTTSSSTSTTSSSNTTPTMMRRLDLTTASGMSLRLIIIC